ncbi:MAG: primosomal protein N' [Clostridia bacterium]|nr:primosomal protein N' [Clostridia bacterium]
MTVDIFLLESNIDFELKYTYRVPENISGEIAVGMFVNVNFGVHNSKRIGIVWSIDRSETPENAQKNGYRLKNISGINYDYMPLSASQMRLCEKIKKRYLCVTGDAVRYFMSPKIKNPKKVKTVSLNIPRAHAEEVLSTNTLRNIGQIKIIETLLKTGDISCSDLIKDYNVSQSSLNTLCKKGFLKIYEKEEAKKFEGTACKYESYPAHTLNDEQENAFLHIKKLLEAHAFKELLLHGVTASGKTEVYLQSIAEVIKNGGKAVMLVPEISLTPQMVKRFYGRLGDCVAVLHSRLTDKQKYEEWMRIKRGEVAVVIGARSAVFAPFKKIDLFIIDEEQEPSYKAEDESVRYHASDIAVMRAEENNSVVVYGSATPRISTYYRGRTGEIDYVKMEKRASHNALPDTTVIDMRESSDKAVSDVFSPQLVKELEQNYINNEQSVLFVQRRGFSKQLLCRDCGKVMRCGKCNIAMTYHSKGNRLICHYCGNTVIAPSNCPSCGTGGFDTRGFGTEKVEKELQRLFPESRTVRMDTDTTSGRDAHEKLISEFVDQNADFLVGTQMIAKGHDFPNVTLVGIVSADSLINMQEYNSSERAFQLIAQVAGRAGRAEKPGRAYIQAYNIDDYAVQSAAEQDYEKFYKNEIILREVLHYPPFYKMAFINFSSLDDRAAYDFGMAVFDAAKAVCNENSLADIEILKPARQPAQKVNGWYKWRVVIKCESFENILNLADKLRYNISALKKMSKADMRSNIDIIK